MTTQAGPEPYLVKCEKCAEVLGEYVELRSPSGRVVGRWLRVGSVFVLSISGQCAKCGEEWHWSPAAMKLKRLLATI